MRTLHRYLFLLLLLCFARASAEQLVVTVTAYNKVTLSGDVPEGVSAQYMQYQSTHYKGRLLAGDSAVLIIEGMPQGRLQGVTLEMHSNQSSGAGAMQMQTDGQTVWQISDDTFASLGWNGTYSSSFVEITKEFDGYVPSADIRIKIEASVNSLYIQSFKIDYVQQASLACEVSFETYSGTPCRPRTESYAGAGVVLPAIPDLSDEWHFLGWAEQWCAMTNIAPEYMSAGETYYPQTDIVLHALYATRLSEAPVLRQVTAPQSGRYALGVLWKTSSGEESVSRILQGGKPDSSHKLETLQCDIYRDDSVFYLSDFTKVPDDCVYLLTFDDDSVSIVHELSGRTLGHKTRYLTNDSIRWLWQVTESKRIMVYYDYDSETNAAFVFSVYPGNGINDIGKRYGKVMQMYPSDMLGFILFPAELSEPQDDIWYASEPVSNGLKQQENAAIIDWYSPIELYDVCGTPAMKGVTNIREIPAGIWLVRQGAVVRKIIR